MGGAPSCACRRTFGKDKDKDKDKDKGCDCYGAPSSEYAAPCYDNRRTFNIFGIFSTGGKKEKEKKPDDSYGAPCYDAPSYEAPSSGYGAPSCACRRTFGKDKDKDKDKGKGC